MLAYTRTRQVSTTSHDSQGKKGYVRYFDLDFDIHVSGKLGGVTSRVLVTSGCPPPPPPPPRCCLLTADGFELSSDALLCLCGRFLALESGSCSSATNANPTEVSKNCRYSSEVPEVGGTLRSQVANRRFVCRTVHKLQTLDEYYYRNLDSSPRPMTHGYSLPPPPPSQGLHE